MMRTPIDSSMELQGKTPADKHRRHARGQALRGNGSSPPAKVSEAQHADRRHPAIPTQAVPDEFLSLIQQAQRVVNEEPKPEPPAPSLPAILKPPHAMMPMHTAVRGTVRGASEIERDEPASGRRHGLMNLPSGSDAALRMAVAGTTKSDVASPVRTAVSRAERGAIEPTLRQQPLQPAIGHAPGAQVNSAAAAQLPRMRAVAANAAMTTQPPQHLPDRRFVSTSPEPSATDEAAPAWQPPIPDKVQSIKPSTGKTTGFQIAAALAQLQPMTHQPGRSDIASGAAVILSGEDNRSEQPPIIANLEKVNPKWQLPIPNTARQVKSSTGRTTDSRIAAALAQLQPVTHQTDRSDIASRAKTNLSSENNRAEQSPTVAKPELEQAANTMPLVPNQPAAGAETMARSDAALSPLPQHAPPACRPENMSPGQAAGASAPHGAIAPASRISSDSHAIELKIESPASESIHVRVRLGHDRFHLKITADSDMALEALYAGQQTLDEALAAAHPAAAPPHVEILRHADQSQPLAPENFDGTSGGAGRELHRGAAQNDQPGRAIGQTLRKDSAKESSHRGHAAARNRAAGIYL